MTMFFRNLGQLFKQDQAQVQQTHATQMEQAGMRLDGVESRLDVVEPRTDATERRLDSVEAHAATAAEELRALRQVLEEGLTRVEELLQKRLEEQEAALGQRIESRFTTLEQLQDARLNSLIARVDIVEEKLAAEAQVLAAQITARAQEIEAALHEQFQQFDVAVDDRLTHNEAATNERLDHYEAAISERLTNYESAVDSRIQMHTDAVDVRLEERLRNIELRADERTVQLTESVNQTFEQRARALDLRVDDRLGQLERNLDQRMTNFEKGIDQRLYNREKFTDAQMVQHTQDVVARTDVLLQQSEQRIDKLRRALRMVLEAEKGAPNKAETLAAFDQLLTPGSSAPSAEVQALSTSSSQSLYHEIVEWKKTATDALNHFTADEQEIVDYILSFSPPAHPTADHYARQHLRRFVTTLQRIPPPRSTAARVLELGSEIHFTPALKKFGGYSKIYCANWSELDAGLSQQITLKQHNGSDVMMFELHNFNAERDRFPYADGYFSLVLCCEMLEHLAHDPMHNLWEINRVLEQDGYLLLTTPNLASARSLEGVLLSCQPYLLSQYNLQNSGGQHHREYTPQEVQDALVAAGFTIVALETEDVWAKSNPAILRLLQQLHLATDLRGDNIFALARKTQAPLERYPKWLYTGGAALPAPAPANTNDGAVRDKKQKK
ncbi:MAG: methyltransferase domain-containing protein [Blastocatellia bacterium]